LSSPGLCLIKEAGWRRALSPNREEVPARGAPPSSSYYTFFRKKKKKKKRMNAGFSMS